MSVLPKLDIGGSPRGLILGLALTVATTGAIAVPAYASGGDPSWQPQASERLVKLPASYIKRSLEQDFTRSELGQALRDIDTEISFKSETLADLQAAIQASEGEVRTDISHQFLVEKREYIDLVSRKIDLRRKALEKKSGVLEGLMKRMGQEDASLTPARRELMERQTPHGRASKPPSPALIWNCWRPAWRRRANIPNNSPPIFQPSTRYRAPSRSIP